MSTSTNLQSSRNLWFVVSGIVTLGAIVIGLIIVVAGDSGSDGHPQSFAKSEKQIAKEVLFEAADGCNLMSEAVGLDEFIRIDKGGSIETFGFTSFVCLADKLDAPQSLRTRIGHTSGIMGAQEDTVGDYLWLWSYNKNNSPSFSLTITLADEEQ